MSWPIQGISVHCCNNQQMVYSYMNATFTCNVCGAVVTREFVEDMAMVRGQFSVLLKPGLAKAMRQAYTAAGTVTGRWSSEDAPTLEAWIKEQEQMAILHPDTHKIPLWRREPHRAEGPITAYRAWDVEWARNYQGQTLDNSHLYLVSVAAACRWEGPVLRSDFPPVDPKVWDKDKTKTPHVFQTAGIHAVKTLEQAKDVAISYRVPVIGELKLWGRVAQFELGYRAEVCMITKLWVATNHITTDARQAKKIIERLADLYQLAPEHIVDGWPK